MATDSILRPGELKDILLKEIQAADLAEIDVREVGTALEVKDGIARIYGLTSAMAGVLIDHIVYRENKLAAVPILKDRILDRENAFWLYQHFTYREDKAKVQEILEH